MGKEKKRGRKEAAVRVTMGLRASSGTARKKTACAAASLPIRPSGAATAPQASGALTGLISVNL